MLWCFVEQRVRRIAPDLDRRCGDQNASHPIGSSAKLKIWAIGLQRFNEWMFTRHFLLPTTAKLSKRQSVDGLWLNNCTPPSFSLRRPGSLLKIGQFGQIRDAEW